MLLLHMLQSAKKGDKQTALHLTLYTNYILYIASFELLLTHCIYFFLKPPCTCCKPQNCKLQSWKLQVSKFQSCKFQSFKVISCKVASCKVASCKRTVNKCNFKRGYRRTDAQTDRKVGFLSCCPS